jgi:hypothetical protein
MNPLNNTVATTEDICSICTDNFKVTDEALQAGCLHVFHNKCIEGWTQTCVKDKNQKLVAERGHSANFERNERSAQSLKNYIGDCPECRNQLSTTATLVKIQERKTTNETELRNKQNELSNNISGALVSRDFSKVKSLMKEGKFCLSQDLIITILKKDIENNNTENIKEILSIIKCASGDSDIKLKIQITEIINSLLQLRNIEIAQILIDYIYAN